MSEMMQSYFFQRILNGVDVCMSSNIAKLADIGIDDFRNTHHIAEVSQ